jgi:Ubiquitin family
MESSISSNVIMEDQVSDETVLWTLSIKAIGKLPDDKSSFDLHIGPQSSLDQLQDMITDQTGLPRSCQRLIYRGRLLNDDSSTKIGDIHGLQCGHTIHLVPRAVPVSTETAVPDTEAAVEQRDDEVPNEDDDDSDDDFLPTLLDRLFGGASDEDDDEEVTETPPSAATNAATADTASSDSSAAVLAVLSSLLSSDEASTTPPTPRAAAAVPASSTTPRRRHVLVPSDLVVPDPGSAEPLRQSLLTLHTMLPTAQQAMSSSSSSPLDVPRQWYVGQWIDVRDTVNQWLEATIVSIVLPSEILPPSVATTHEATPTRPSPLQHEPVVKATDLDGRIRLLIEPSSEDDNVEGIPAGHRLRSNQHVQLLLIHYNGWPHKWDEWIRSDSERIRPFRVRTRHGASSTLSSPTLVSPWADAPTTRVTAAASTADDTTESADERRAVLHELGRVAAQVQELCTLVTTTTPLDSSSSRDLPWSRPVEPAVATYQQWQAVAPLLDRLGRAMVDAAPHALALAQTMQEQAKVQPPAAAPVEDAVESARNGTLGGFLSLLSRASPETSVSSSNMVATTTTGSTDSILAEPSDERSVDEIDPDFTDFGSGVVNTSRGVARSAPRRSERASTTDELSNALGAYLALASLSGALSRVSNDNDDDDDTDNSPAVNLARLMRSGGTNGGIDIHIHAIVAAPGTTTTNNNAWANILLAAPRTTSSSSSSSATTTDTSPAAPTASDLWDENGLFDELYSETPAPLNLAEEAAPSEPAPVVAAATATPPANVTEDGTSPPRRRRLSRGATPERQSGSSRRATTPPTPTPNGFLSRLFRR